jgi:hypothetical protein
MAQRIVSCDLAEALEAQEIDASVFLPFTIRCLQGEGVRALDAPLTVRVVGRDRVERVETMLVHWSPGDVPALPPAVQSHTVTEWGALGIACAILHGLGDGLKITGVATEGDRFDYWVGDDNLEWGLEISGTTAEKLEERRDDKIRQLLRNPYGVDGFVIVVRFASKEAWFTFHRVDEQGTG